MLMFLYSKPFAEYYRPLLGVEKVQTLFLPPKIAATAVMVRARQMPPKSTLVRPGMFYNKVFNYKSCKMALSMRFATTTKLHTHFQFKNSCKCLMLG